MTQLSLRPQPGPQEEFLKSTADVVLYAGDAGCGKSFAALLEACRHVHVPGFTCVMFRRTMPQVRQQGGLWDTSNRIYPHTGGVPREQLTEWRWKSGACVQFKSLQHEWDKYQFDGAQITYLVFDELNHFSETQFWYVASRALRSPCGVTPYCRATCNPDGGSWVRQFIDWWIDDDGLIMPERAGVVRYFARGDKDWIWDDEQFEFDNMDAMSFTVFSGSLSENKALLKVDPGYKGRLAQLPEFERRRLLEGDWNARPESLARIYRDFEARRHYMDAATALKVKHGIRRNAFQLWEGWDFGSGAGSATAVVWILYDAFVDRAYVWDWLVVYEKPAEWIAPRVLSRRPCPIYKCYGDPAGQQRDSDQSHWFDRLSEHGIRISPSVNRPREAIHIHAWALRNDKILLNPALSERSPIGPLTQGSQRAMKSMTDCYMEYEYDLKQDYDPSAEGWRPAAARPKKNWASHPMDAMSYIYREFWGHVAPGVGVL